MTNRVHAMLAVLAALGTASCSKKGSPTQPTPPSGPGTLQVFSIPGSATARLDGAGTSVYTMAQFNSVGSGSHQVSLSMLGYADTTVTVSVAAGAVTRDTVALRPLAGTPRTITELWNGYFNYPGPIALGSDGYFRVTANVNLLPTFLMISPAGAIERQVLIPDVTANPAFDIAMDSNNRTYVVSDGLNGSIFVFDHVGALQTSIGRRSTSDGHVSGIAIGPGDTLHISARYAGVGVVEKYTTGGAFLYAFPTGANTAGPIEVDASGNVYVAAGATPQVLKFNKTGALLATWPTPDWPRVIGRGPGGTVYVASPLTNGQVEKAPIVMQVFNAAGSVVAQWGVENQTLGSVRRFAVDASGQVFLPFHNDRRVLRYTP